MTESTGLPREKPVRPSKVTEPARPGAVVEPDGSASTVLPAANNGAPSTRVRKIGRTPTVAIGALVFLFLVYGMNAVCRQIFYFVLPSMVVEFNLTPGEAGVISAVVTMLVATVAIPAGKWFDRGGHGWARKYRNGIVAAGYFLFSILTGLAFLTTTIWNVVILQGIKNIFGGAGEAVEVTAMVEWYPVEKRGLALGIQHAAYPWMTGIAAIAVGSILATFGPENWRYVFLIIPLAMIPIWIGWWAYSTKTRYAKFEKQVDDANLTKPLAGGTGAEQVHAAPGAVMRSLRNPNILVPAIASMCGIMIYTGISFWLPSYIAFVGGFSFAEAAAYSAVFTITGGIGQIFWGSMSDYLGRKPSLFIAFLWLAVGIFLLRYSAVSVGMLIFVQLFAGLATNAIFPVLYAFGSDSAEPGALGTANSILLFFLYIGGISPLVIGWLIGVGGGFDNATGYFYALYFMVALAVVSAIILALFTRETVGWYKSRDKALVSLDTTHVHAGLPQN
jgi:MFS family permease